MNERPSSGLTRQFFQNSKDNSNCSKDNSNIVHMPRIEKTCQSQPSKYKNSIPSIPLNPVAPPFSPPSRSAAIPIVNPHTLDVISPIDNSHPKVKQISSLPTQDIRKLPYIPTLGTIMLKVPVRIHYELASAPVEGMVDTGSVHTLIDERFATALLGQIDKTIPTSSADTISEESRLLQSANGGLSLATALSNSLITYNNSKLPVTVLSA